VESEKGGEKMKTSFALCVDIDNTIAEPRWFHDDFEICKQSYITAGLVTEQEAVSLDHHQRLFLLPHVLMTHVPLPGAVEMLQHLAHTDHCVTYLTVRNSIQPEQCKQVHEQTRVWLEEQGFPNPRQVQFFWDFPEKLLATLDAPAPRVLFLDDRPRHLLEGYRRLVERDPARAAQVRERVILVAFGYQTLDELPQIPDAPRVVPLPNWAYCGELLSQLEGEC
jgi:hypothetical protein